MTSRILIAALLLAPAVAAAQVVPVGKDVVYAHVDGRDLALDLYLPPNVTAPPLVVWVHGGAWASGTKANAPAQFVERGYAMASLDFRQSTEARFPAQVHDIKAAIRFLRASAQQYGYRADRIAIAGSSSGGHLAALVGVTNSVAALEGSEGEHLDQSSSVQAILDYFGASDLRTILAQSTSYGVGVRRPALVRLLGALPNDARQLAELASPMRHLDRDDPPLFLIHGDADPQMPPQQSVDLKRAYDKLGLDAELHILPGAKHGGEVFFSSANLDAAIAFLRRTIGP
jgi:acetyl esterase/lipase